MNDFQAKYLAEGLSGDYRLLAEFNHIVLAGHEREGGYGVEFITWERIRDGTSLWQGHYCDNNYASAKQDFAVRSGLIPSSLLFTREQLAVIFDAAQNMTTLDLVSNPEQGKLLEGIMKQIEEAVPWMAIGDFPILHLCGWPHGINSKGMRWDGGPDLPTMTKSTCRRCSHSHQISIR